MYVWFWFFLPCTFITTTPFFFLRMEDIHTMQWFCLMGVSNLFCMNVVQLFFRDYFPQLHHFAFASSSVPTQLPPTFC